MRTEVESNEGVVETVKLRCACGERLVVPATLRGQRTPCTGCERTVRVPASRSKALDSAVMLLTLGIDPEAARRAYVEERRRNLCCSLCARKLTPEERPTTDEVKEDELVCSACSSAAVEQRTDVAPKQKGKVDAVRRAASDADLRRRSWAYGALFFAGTTGLLVSVVGLGTLAAAAVGLVVATLGARATWRAYANA